MFVNGEGCRSGVRWNNKKQLLKSSGELNAMLVLLFFFYLVEACATILSCSIYYSCNHHIAIGV
jgi:hypothetical protein